MRGRPYTALSACEKPTSSSYCRDLGTQTGSLVGSGGPRRDEPTQGSGLVLLYARDFAHLAPAFALKGDQVLIGREPGPAGLAIDDGACSRLHARVARVDGEWIVTDLGSRNGTFVNDRS